jgi:hypothetical protein
MNNQPSCGNFNSLSLFLLTVETEAQQTLSIKSGGSSVLVSCPLLRTIDNFQLCAVRRDGSPPTPMITTYWQLERHN